ncbi:MAG: hypothetical protein ACSNEK_04615 [Parachlamydiaceae bacterium]
MRALGFAASVSNSGLKNFSVIAAFDDYFCLSKRKYRVIEPCSFNGRKGYRVEKDDVKPNIPLNILKVISYITGIVPLVMGIGKLISRNRHRFFTESSQNTAASLKPIKRATAKLKVVPPLDKDLQDRDLSIHEFKNQALATFRYASLPHSNLDFSLDEEQKDSLIHINENKYWLSHRPIPGARALRGGAHFVFFLDSAPGFVFKPMYDRQEAEDYVGLADQARQVVIDNNLYLLHVPRSKVININEAYFVMQERANLVAENHREQKGVYQCCWDDEEMNDYTTVLFEQLIQFICISHFADVKYDNIPLATDGRAALVDLDSRDVLVGLIAGGAGKNDGIFNYIPFKHIDHFMMIAKKHLSQDLFQELELRIADIKSRAEKKVKKEENYLEFMRQNAIYAPFQPISTNLSKRFKNRKKRKLATFLVERINHNLSRSTNFSVKVGRTTTLWINNYAEFREHANKIRKQRSSLPMKSKKTPVRPTLLTTVLNELKEAGYIYKYKLTNDYLRIIC